MAANGTHPLSGIRALDLGQVWAGPLLGSMLADHGAEVIKVLTGSRTWGAVMKGVTALDNAELVQQFQTFDRNKYGIALNLRTEEGRDIFLRLVEQSDIVFENFHPDVMGRLGVGYGTLSKVNPRIIMASLSASGATHGPWRDLVTYGPSLAALYGLKSVLGYHGEEKLVEDPADLDPTAAAHAFVALLAALEYRERTGRGQFIDMAQGETALCRMAEPIMDFVMNSRVAGPQGNRYAGFAPHGTYRCAGDDEWVSIAVGTDDEWRAMIEAMGRPAWALDPRFGDGYGRAVHQDELDERVEAWTREHSPWEATNALQAHGVAAFPILRAEQIIVDPNDEALRTNIAIEHPAIAHDQVLVGAPWKYSKTPATLFRPTPRFAEHNHEVLTRLLGMTAEEIDRLVEAGVVA